MNNKMIEEMAKILDEDCGDCHKCNYYDNEDSGGIECIFWLYAERIYKAGYRKIHENAAVLTREEYERLLKEETLCERLGNDIDVKLKYIYELEDKVAQTRKETAEKFAEMALREIKAISAKSEYLLDDESVYEDSSLENVLEKVKNEIIIGERQ